MGNTGVYHCYGMGCAIGTKLTLHALIYVMVYLD